MKRVVLMAAALTGMMALSVTANAAELTQEVKESVFDMSTDYPGVYAKPGENTSFSLDFLNTTDESIDASLTIEEMPENWEGFFKGKSGEISKVHVNSSIETMEDLATFSLSIPSDAEEGVYTIKLLAESDTGTKDDVSLEVNVSQQENGASTYEAEYEHQQAPSGTKFSFETTLVNNKGEAQSYSLSAKAPEGWEVSFIPSGESTSVASVNVEAGESKVINVDITPAQSLTEGDYTIPITAVSANETISTELGITITGKYAVTLSTPSERLSFDAYSNENKDITLTVANTGNVDLENLNLTTSAPADWEVTFDESTIDLLEAGATKEVTAHVKPASDSMTGDYVLDVEVKNNAVDTTTEFRVSVKTRTTWGLAAAGIIVVLVGILGFIFKKYGRR